MIRSIKITSNLLKIEWIPRRRDCIEYSFFSNENICIFNNRFGSKSFEVQSFHGGFVFFVLREKKKKRLREDDLFTMIDLIF